MKISSHLATNTKLTADQVYRWLVKEKKKINSEQSSNRITTHQNIILNDSFKNFEQNDNDIKKISEITNLSEKYILKWHIKFSCVKQINIY